MNNLLPILAIETSGENCGACIYYDDKKFIEITLRQKHVASEKLLQIIDQLFSALDTSLENMGALAISSGPGSFTGLRIGMSAAKGLAFGSNKPIIPVPTFEALALQVSSIISPDIPFILSNKVNVEETYFAKFRSGINHYIKEDDIQVISNEELQEKIEPGISVYGNSIPSGSSDFFHKDLTVPSPYWIAKWSYGFGKDLVTLDYDFLEPAYFKNFIVRQ